MKSKIMAALVAAGLVAYGLSAFAPATVSAATVGRVTSTGSFLQDISKAHPLFVHITVADVLHNDPCHLGTNNIVCPTGE